MQQVDTFARRAQAELAAAVLEARGITAVVREAAGGDDLGAATHGTVELLVPVGRVEEARALLEADAPAEDARVSAEDAQVSAEDARVSAEDAQVSGGSRDALDAWRSAGDRQHRRFVQRLVLCLGAVLVLAAVLVGLFARL